MNSSGTAARPLTVPSRHVEAFNRIRTLEDNQFSEVLDVLTIIDSTAHRNEMIERLNERTHLNQHELHAVIDALMSLAAHRHQSRSTAHETATRVASSPQFADDSGPDIGFLNRVEQLLDCGIVHLSSKAIYLGASHERLFSSAQILTDLRPLFDIDVVEDLGPSAAVVSHTLMLHYVGSDGRHNDFFVALDDEDIEEMSQALERARQKAASLRTLLEDSGITYISSED